MRKEIRTVIYDKELGVEAYRLEGIAQMFPNHFHDHYVIGLIEDGERYLSCKNRDYILKKGHIVLFNPGDNHTCAPVNNCLLDYRGLNIPVNTMLNLVEGVTGKREFAGFSDNVVCDNDLMCNLSELHEMIMEGSKEFAKEEYLLLLISLILHRYGQTFSDCGYCTEIEKACVYMNEHFSEHVCLDQICDYSGLSRSTLLRAFTKSKGVTPYRYLETIRINKAKKLLENGATPVEAALQTGFSDQSHFTNYFNRYIGLTPGMYREIFLDKTE